MEYWNMDTFKRCTACGHLWFSREKFLNDPNTQLVGYQVNFENLELGFFLFNHMACKSTIAIPAGQFRDLYNGPIFQEIKQGTENCPEYCLHEGKLLPCPEQCECAYVREVLDIVHHWPKHD
jgi:hypothetical protein